MLIWESPSVDPSKIEALATHSRGAAECFLREDNAGSLIVCDQGDAPKGVIEKRVTPLFSRGRAGPEAGPLIFCVGIWTPEDFREELCAWYQYEHGPILLECPGWEGFQFVEAATDRGCQFYVLHRLASRAALDSAQRKRSRSTPWFHRLARNKWFDKPFERVLCSRMSLLWH
jgi:hypothetical protein